MRKNDLTANKILIVADSVKVMRKPGPGMIAFDSKALPDADAEAVARYILTTFK